jgi:hypothetical protein
MKNNNLEGFKTVRRATITERIHQSIVSIISCLIATGTSVLLADSVHAGNGLAAFVTGLIALTTGILFVWSVVTWGESGNV